MIRFSFILIGFLSYTTEFIFGQTYNLLVKQADSLYNTRNYKESNELYQRAFKIERKNPHDLYNAACSAALADDIKNSFEFLESAFQNGWFNIDHLRKDTDLENLHFDERWIALLNRMQIKIDSIEAGYDKSLQKELLEILKDDQDIRNQYIVAAKKLGYNNPTVDSLSKIRLFKDSINLTKVMKILDEKGWVGRDKVGEQASQTFFLVIQHSDLKTQEKYLPTMREAVKNGKASSIDLALLEDRVALQQGKRQIYGSQIYLNQQTNKFYVAPLEDPENVDKRRLEVGLEVLSDYVRQWDIDWNIEEYKKQLPTFEKLQIGKIKTK